MLPTPLVGAVQRYKEDTNSVAAWLASTAKLCGFRSDLHAIPSSKNENQKTSGRLKGKARTEAKNSHVTTEKATPTKYTVALDDFVPMAEFIAACRKPVISVPACFVSTLDRVIRVRSTFKGRMTEHGIETDEKSDKAHSYFVDILEKVRNILGPRISPNVSKTAPAAFDTGKPTKGFHNLPLFEPSQEFLEAPDIERPCKTSKDATIYEAESHESFGDAMVTWFLMLTDADNIRQHIKWAWEGYRDGTFDLTSVAVATNVGMQLVRKMAEQFEPIVEKHGCELKEFIDTHFFTCAIALGFSNQEILKWRIDGIDDNLFALADRTFWSAACWMMPLASRCHGPALWALCSDSFSCRALQGDRDAKSNEEKFDEDRAILVQLWGETVLFCKYVDVFPVEGEFMLGFRKVAKMERGHKFITFEMLFAAQIHLDVRHVLREKATDAFQIFKHQVMTMREQLDEYDKLKEVCPGWSKQYTDLDGKFQEVQRALDSSLNDKVYKIKAFTACNEGRSYARIEKHKLLKLSPILCGLTLFCTQAYMHQLGFELTRHPGVLISMAHIYNALQQEGFLEETSWADMDALQSCFETSGFFKAGKPSNPLDYDRRLLLQLGAPASIFSQGKKKTRNTKWRGWNSAEFVFRGTPCGMELNAPVSRLYQQAHGKHGSRPTFTIEDLHDMVSQSEYTEITTQDGTVVYELLSPREKQQIKKQKPQSKAKRTSKTPELSAGLLVRSLTLALAAESFQATFPYLEMHSKCLRFLLEIRDQCYPVFTEIFGFDWEKGITLSSFVVHILSVMRAENGHPEDYRPLKKAAHAIHKICSGPEGEIILGRIVHVPRFPRPVAKFVDVPLFLSNADCSSNLALPIAP